MASPITDGIDLLPEVTCPNCWHKFPPESALAVAAHGELIGDPRLDDQTEPRRFLPTRFTPDCAAIDEKDRSSFEVACPECHLLVPRVLFERHPATFISMVGATGVGKSFLLAALARQMESTLPQRLGLAFTEPHPRSNTLIRWYKTQLFHTNKADALVSIPRTPVGGSQTYQTVLHDGDKRLHPRPMFFQVAPTGRHPNARRPLSHTRTLCLYDHSGEHCLPYHLPAEKEAVTAHLSRASGLIFVLDPTQETAFLDDLQGDFADPQIKMWMGSAAQPVRTLESQDSILAAADAEVKKWKGRQVADPLDTPLVIALAKYDLWSKLGTGDLPPFAIGGRSGEPDGLQGFHIATVERVSGIMRQLLLTKCPSVVATAERFSRHVCYVPVSATGCRPAVECADFESGAAFFKFNRGELQPIWAEVPLLWILHQLTSGLVPIAGSRSEGSPTKDGLP